MPQTTVGWNSSHEGMRITVNAMVKQPARVRARILRLLDQQFLADAILRPGPKADGGSVMYEESTPMFANEDAADVAEFGEIPAVVGESGIPKAVATTKKGLGLLISREMRDRDDVGKVDQQMIQIRNSMVRTWENVFLNALLTNAGIHTLAATAAWSSGTSKIRFDLAQALYLVANSDADSTDNTGDNKFMFEPDTLIISQKTASDFLSSDDVAKVFVGGDIASENLQYKGKMPKQFFGLDVVRSWRLAANQAIVLQRKVVGGISDERPLEVTPLREVPDNTETFRSNVVRRSAVFIDQPKAACLITGV
jgi:hypothetical protein